MYKEQAESSKTKGPRSTWMRQGILMKIEAIAEKLPASNREPDEPWSWAARERAQSHVVIQISLRYRPDF